MQLVLDEGQPNQGQGKPMPSKFGERVKEVRERKGMSAYRLSQLVGLTRSAVSQIESGKADPSWETAVRISLALGVPVTDLVTPDIQLPPSEPPGKPGRPRKDDAGEPPPKKPRGKK